MLIISHDAGGVGDVRKNSGRMLMRLSLLGHRSAVVLASTSETLNPKARNS